MAKILRAAGLLLLLAMGWWWVVGIDISWAAKKYSWAAYQRSGIWFDELAVRHRLVSGLDIRRARLRGSAGRSSMMEIAAEGFSVIRAEERSEGMAVFSILGNGSNIVVTLGDYDGRTESQGARSKVKVYQEPDLPLSGFSIDGFSLVKSEVRVVRRDGGVGSLLIKGFSLEADRLEFSAGRGEGFGGIRLQGQVNAESVNNESGLIWRRLSSFRAHAEYEMGRLVLRNPSWECGESVLRARALTFVIDQAPMAVVADLEGGGPGDMSLPSMLKECGAIPSG